MASLTESSFIFFIMNSELPKKQNEPNKPKKWYDRVYLCLKYTEDNPNNSEIIEGFKCYKYFSFVDAKKDFSKTNLHNNNNNNNNNNHSNIEHKFIPICKWVPNIMDKYVLQWKLKNNY